MQFDTKWISSTHDKRSYRLAAFREGLILEDCQSYDEYDINIVRVNGSDVGSEIKVISTNLLDLSIKTQYTLLFLYDH